MSSINGVPREKVTDEVFFGNSPTSRETVKSDGRWTTKVFRVTEELVVSESSEQPARLVVFQDANIVCSRKLSKDELSKLGLVAIYPWSQLEHGSLYQQAIGEFDSNRT